MNKPKFIQTLLVQTNTDPIKSKLGFLSAEFNWMSWALSCLQLNKLYGEVELYTNKGGKEVLIDRLHLPYTKVHVVLDDFDIPENMRFLPKTCTYSLQTEPFLHIDGDIFLWEKFDDAYLQSNLLTQNLELSNKLYRAIHGDLAKADFWLPDSIKHELNCGDDLAAYNLGLFGGNDVDFFKHLKKEAFKIIDANREKIALVDAGEFSLIYEQHLFYCLVKQLKKQVSTYTPMVVENLDYDSFANFADVPHKTKYIHLMGNFKRIETTCLQLAKRLRQNYPDYYYRIIAKCKKAGVKMHLSFYAEPSAQHADVKENVNWDNLYEIEKDQQHKFEIAFSDPSTLNNTFFQFNKSATIKHPAQTAGPNTFCWAPNSLMKKFNKAECDELDETLIDLLQMPQQFYKLLNNLKECIDDEVLQNEYDEFITLITLRVKNGCINNWYHIIDNTILNTNSYL